jgi:CDP-glycerol glycerophosphotransferase
MVQFIKKYKIVYWFFFHLVSLLVRAIGMFIRVKRNRILFISFGGRRFDDSPKVIYEAMMKDKRFDKIEYIWAFNDPEQYKIMRGIKVKVDTFSYLYYALSSNIWVVNSSAERGLSFKKRKTTCFNTWHGTPMKKMGKDIESSKSFASLAKETDDIFLVQGEFEANIFIHAMGINQHAIRYIGYPRNDELTQNDEDRVKHIKKLLNIPFDKKVILYTPTFREYNTDVMGNKIFNPPIHLDKWYKLLGKEYVLLYRLHYDVSKSSLMSYEGKFAMNMTNYPSLNDLIIVSDLLISDYSSVFFDYSITSKPMLCFAYDIAEYTKERGLYLDLSKDMPSGYFDNEDDLLREISDNLHSNQKLIVEFRKRFIPYYGNATKQAIDIIDNLL